MGSKLTGYDFWNNVLKKPKYVAAPMVDMSELSFRMLCRQYNAQLCYSPMLHSQQFLQDSLYRSDNFSTCPEDRPLIVQFCSNDPFDFVNAATLVSSQCDAVDLNLGCPQAIAKKGHYGAFLQDDWELVHSIVKKAATDLPVPVTCKMRLLSGNVRESVDFAKMLENAGCSVLAVHGRTREQKGHGIGYASWQAINVIKDNVNIPVIANGNILSIRDVSKCLHHTGADAVMSAESLLQNPALFTRTFRPVWIIVKEYLQLAEKYNTPIRCVRSHLFKILYLCIHQDRNIQQILAEGKTYADFYSVCEYTENLRETYGKPTGYLKLLRNLEQPLTSAHTLDQNSSVETLTGSMSTLFTEEGALYDEDDVPCITRNIAQDLNRKEPLDYLDFWMCHSRPRVVDDEKKTRGCYRKYFDSSPERTNSLVEDAEEQYMSKKKLRRAKHHERVLAAMKEKRKSQKMRRKQKLAEQRQLSATVEVECEDKVKITKKEKKRLIRERLLKAQGTAPKVCINLGFAFQMDNKELTRLSSQLRRLYGSNRQSDSPLHLYFCNFSESDDLYNICLTKNDGFSSYVVEMTEESPEDLFNSEDIIYLSPDSENVLTSLNRSKIYVIGGIVDGTVKKDLSLNYAKEHNITTARLPIREYLVRCSQNPGTTVLTVNQVFDILLKYYETEDWVTALSDNVPLRKGYCAPTKDSNLTSTVAPGGS